MDGWSKSGGPDPGRMNFVNTNPKRTTNSVGPSSHRDVMSHTRPSTSGPGGGRVSYSARGEAASFSFSNASTPNDWLLGPMPSSRPATEGGVLRGGGGGDSGGETLRSHQPLVLSSDSQRPSTTRSTARSNSSHPEQAVVASGSESFRGATYAHLQQKKSRQTLRNR